MLQWTACEARWKKSMWYVDLMPCWMETWFMWCYYFCAGISVSINGLKKWDELVAWIFIWAVYIVLNLISWKLMVGWEIFGPSLWTMLNWAHPQMGRGADVTRHVSNHVIGHVNLHVIIAIHVIAKSTVTSSSMSSSSQQPRHSPCHQCMMWQLNL